MEIFLPKFTWRRFDGIVEIGQIDSDETKIWVSSLKVFQSFPDDCRELVPFGTVDGRSYKKKILRELETKVMISQGEKRQTTIFFSKKNATENHEIHHSGLYQSFGL